MRTSSFSLFLIFLTNALIAIAPANAHASAACQYLFRSSNLGLIEGAQALGLTPRVFSETFRFDSRPPEVIKSEGFQPNPEKPPGSIQDHSTPSSYGSSSFVSLTSRSDNFAIIRSGFVPPIAYTEVFPSERARMAYIGQFTPERASSQQRIFDEIVATMRSSPEVFEANEASLTKTQRAWRAEVELSRKAAYRVLRSLQLGPSADPPMVFTFREYRIKDALGVETTRIGIETESEVVTDRVPGSQVLAYREVHFVFDGNHMENDTRAEWINKRGILLFWQRFFCLHQIQSQVDVGPWVSM